MASSHSFNTPLSPLSPSTSIRSGDHIEITHIQANSDNRTSRLARRSPPRIHYHRSGRNAVEQYEDARLREPDDERPVPLFFDPEIWDPLHPETFHPPALNEGVYWIGLHGHLTQLAPERGQLIPVGAFPWWYHHWTASERLSMAHRASHFYRWLFSESESSREMSEREDGDWYEEAPDIAAIPGDHLNPANYPPGNEYHHRHPTDPWWPLS